MAVVVVSWEAAALTQACVARLQRQLAPGDELVVVDNGSTDGTGELATRFDPDGVEQAGIETEATVELGSGV